MNKIATIHTVAPTGFKANLIEVECDMTRGLPGLQIVGLGNRSVSEAKERVKSALNHSDLSYPARRLTINLAPAEIPKDGTQYDLPIAIAILKVSGQLGQVNTSDCAFAGELSLDGRLRPITGAVSIAESLAENGVKRLILPLENVSQASLVDNIEVIGATNLREVYLHLLEEINLCKKPYLERLNTLKSTLETHSELASEGLTSIDDIIGQTQAKRALAIAAAGRHNLLINGPPGTGKTMLARALNSLLPQLNHVETIQVTKLHALAGEAIDHIVQKRPFRTPHHTTSITSLLGGGVKSQPGEVSLAHLGTLFLDELLEFPRQTLEALRQPLEDRLITVSRLKKSIKYPADFMMVATTNPCPCGYLGDEQRECTCTTTQINSYAKRLSGPLVDRIDLAVTVTRPENNHFLGNKSSYLSQQIEYKNLIRNAIKIQNNRYNSCLKNNANISSSDINTFVRISSASSQLLDQASRQLKLSTRSFLKVIRVSQTIADLEAAPIILPQHISEALSYRLTVR